jgi:hypothetical protein
MKLTKNASSPGTASSLSGGTPSAGLCKKLTTSGQNWTAYCGQWFIAVAAGLFITTSASAAVRYVDGSVASSGNGQSWVTAWKAVANITGLSAGDTVYFSGGSAGQTYSASNWTPAGGTRANPITYAVGQDAGHNGMVTFTGSGNFLSGNLTGVSINGAVNGQQRMTANYGNNAVIYSDGQNTSGFKFLYVIFTGGIWCRSEYVEIAYCNGTSPLSFTDDSMIAHIGDAGTQGWGVNSIHNNYFKCWRKKTAGQGFDCLKWCGSMNVYSNQFIAAYNASYTGGQHGDGWQGNGEYVQIYNNHYENWISYPILNEMYGNCAHWRIYNNIFLSGTESGIDWGAHQAIAIGFNPSSPGTMTDFIIANNTIVGNGSSRGIHINYPSAGTIGSGCYIVNNIIYNSASSVLTGSGNPIVSNNTGGGTAGLAFVNNSLYPSGDFHLIVGATAAIDKGISPAYLTVAFATDGDGNARTGTWDIGAFEYGSGGLTTNAVLSVSPSGLSFGSVTVGTTNDLTFTVRNAGGGTLAGTASVAAPFSVLAGGTYSLSSNQSQPITVRYIPIGVGTSSQTVSFTGGGGAMAMVSGSGESLATTRPSPPSNLVVVRGF